MTAPAAGASALRLRRPHPTPSQLIAALARLSPAQYLICTGLAVLAALMVLLTANLVVLSGLEQHAAETREFARLRQQLALGVAPTGPVDAKGRLLALGTPMAELEIPAVGVSEVVLEGTTSAVLMSGPGHLRDTVFPGAAGTSVIFGRAWAYGSPFGGIHHLRPGDPIRVTTGVGATTFKVIDVRTAGDPVPPPLASGSARLTLVTATGFPFMPDGVRWVDADASGTAPAAASVGVTSVPHSELALATDTANLWVLALWLQALLLLTVGTALAWRAWGPIRTWIMCLPPIALVAFFVTGGVARLLPNLL